MLIDLPDSRKQLVFGAVVAPDANILSFNHYFLHLYHKISIYDNPSLR